MGTAHAAPGVKQSMSSYGRLATICNAMLASVWRCILLRAPVTVVFEVFASAISQGLPSFATRKINFVLVLVAEVVQGEFPQPHVRPCFNGLQKMACDDCLVSRALVLYSRPVPKIPFWGLSYGVGDVSEPWAHGKAVEEGRKCRNPLSCGNFVRLNFACERRVDNLLPRPLGEYFRKCVKLVEISKSQCHSKYTLGLAYAVPGLRQERRIEFLRRSALLPARIS